MDLEKQIAQWPLIGEMSEQREVFWGNPRYGQEAECPFHRGDIEDAAERLDRFAPYIQKAFPETEKMGGIIESPLREIPQMQKALGIEGRKNLVIFSVSSALFALLHGSIIKCSSPAPI